MKKELVYVIIFIIIIVIIILGINLYARLYTNKTFFKNTYIGVQNQEIFIPRYSFFENESGMTVASFKSLKSKKTLEKEIENYMKDFEYFNNFEEELTNVDRLTYGYKKGDLFIQSYKVVDDILFRRIYIIYWE